MGFKNMQQQKRIAIDGIEWDLKITRNMSFWHQWISSYGHYHCMKDFGVNSPLHELAVTFNSTETHIFISEPNYSLYNAAFLRAVASKRKVDALEKKYYQYAKNLLVALNECDKKLNIKNWRRFVKEYTRYCPGLFITVSIGRVLSELLGQKLEKIGMDNNKIAETIASITYPAKHTPLFLSQLELLKIGARLQTRKISGQTKNRLLAKWFKKYQHIPVNFCEEPWTMNDARAQLKAVMQKVALKEITILKKEHQGKIKAARARLKLINDKEVSLLAYAIATGTSLNEFRKGIFSKVSLGYRGIFRRVAQMADLNNWRDCFYLCAEEMGKIIKGEKIDVKKLILERRAVAFIPTAKGEIKFLSASDIKKLADHINFILGKNKIEITAPGGIIKGFSASKGLAEGVVKVVLSSKDFDKLRPGEILVTTMTSVDFVPVMKRAAAFVTNESGITSHASIVAREMNKPCIIGTKIATKVLHDGDLVEVDANQGVVRKISPLS
jgi:phosphohistidine swiveling domain-containing protein